MKQDMTKEDLLLVIDQYADEVLRGYVNQTLGAMRARASVVIAVTALFEQIEAGKVKPVKEIEGVAV